MNKALWMITAVATAAGSIGTNYSLKRSKVVELPETALNKIDEDTQRTERPLESDKEASEAPQTLINVKENLLTMYQHELH